ncbi:putative cysteine desulfurase [Rubripirellula tenax]|uniref:Putative cysteine desulfurase n=1 Tax=Rubripirellula tenax TaxID=2528015 RepID=A0A5C6EDX3_9BACT|nr:aminotransferase class V-fold PLP-dependent enzyme [Rubripirellula tenax]TWU47232.1 putative cysteine desulfurase [Rubripirellula tenax]
MVMGKNRSSVSTTDGGSATKIAAPVTLGFDPSDEKLLSEPWKWWRDQMPVARKIAYFDHAAVAPLSQPAATAIAELTNDALTSGDSNWPSWSARLGNLRKSASSLLNCSIDEICLIPNTTTGINFVADGWPWEPGDNVILPNGEFPSNLFPWMNQKSKGVEVRIVPRRSDAYGESEVSVDDLIDRIDASTRIIAVSWVGYASGFRMDIDSLVHRAHERGVAVFLDAIQGLGMYPLDLAKTPVDFLAADGHKWLLGPEGAGVAMIRRDHLDRLRCGTVGWGSVKNSHNYNAPAFDLKDDATRFEPGSPNMLGGAALAASMEIFLRVRHVHGDQAIENRVLDLTEQLDQKLSGVGATTSLPADRRHRSGILNFSLPGVAAATFRERAIEQNIVLSCRGAGVRASVHAYNDDDDIDRLVAVADSF